MEVYEKVANIRKWNLAVKNLGPKATQAQVLAEYISYGGLVLGDPSTALGDPKALRRGKEKDLPAFTQDKQAVKSIRKIKETK